MGFVADEEHGLQSRKDARGRDYDDGTSSDGSLRTDAPPRWTDISNKNTHKSLTDAEITRAIERRFGITPSSSREAAGAGTLIPGALQGNNHVGIAAAALHAAGIVKGTAKMLNGEVLEPHMLPPGTAPNFETSTMQEFCGSPTAAWGPVVDAHLSACFIQTFVFGLVNIAFIIAAVHRLRSLLSTPPPPPRALTRPAMLKVGGSALMAVYLIVMFAIHLAFDYGAPFQWLAYPSSCVTWSICVAVLLLESRVGAPTTWVCRMFWIASFIASTFLLWSNLAEMDRISTSDMSAFVIHYCLYTAMGALAIFLREDPHDYSKLAMDFSEMSFDEDKTSASEDASVLPGHSGNEANHPDSIWQLGHKGDHDSNNTILRRILMLFSDEKWHALTSIACCFIGAPIEIVQFIYIGMVVDDCAVPDGPRALGGYVAVLVALYLMEAVSSASQLILTMMVGERMVARFRQQIFLAVIKQDIVYLEGGGGARAHDICNRVEHDLQRVQDAATLRSSMLLQSLIQILVGTVFLWALSWKLTLIALAILPIIALLMLAQSTVLQSYSKRAMEVLSQLESLACELVTNIKTVRSMARENAEKTRLGNEIVVLYNAARAMGIAHGIADGLGVLVLKGCMVLGILYGGTLVHDNELSGGILVSYVLISLQVVMAMSVVPPLIGDMSKGLAAAARIFDILDRSPVINARGGLALASLEGRVEFKEVTLFYPSQPDVAALNRIGLAVEAGSHLAVCGPGGCGKSSMLALVQRFLDPQQGLVLIDDTDVSSFDPQWLRQHMAFVPQEPLVFACSVAQNMTYGLSDVKQHQIEAAAQLFGLDALVDKMPEQYKTELGREEGGNEARGQVGNKDIARLVGLARALLKQPRILLLDEPLRGLSAPLRLTAAAGLARLVEGRTVMSATQEAGRELALMADRVAVVSKGRVVEVGRHAELLRLGGVYASLMPSPSPAPDDAMPPAQADGRGARPSRVLDLLARLEAAVPSQPSPGGSGPSPPRRAAFDEMTALAALY